MTLMKSLLLGSAAGIVAIASAQAADLPTKKGAPAEQYVKICSITVNGKPVVGWTLPGSDTCVKLSGYVTGQVEGGNLKTSETTAYTTIAPTVGVVAGKPAVVAGTPFGTQTAGTTLSRPDFGYTTRLNFGFDAVSNTAYGPLTAHAEMQFENGSGFDNTGTGAYINLAYVTWAGLTAGKAPSFFSFTGGGAAWANFFSPDQQGFNQPDVLAYTASFGGGFSASIAAASPGSNGGSGGGTDFDGISGNNAAGGAQGQNFTFNGQRWPDIIGNLKVSQGWGSAQVSGVAHEVSVTGFDGTVQRTWGFGIDAGVSFNLPTIGAGDQILFTGVYTQHAAWFSGIPDGMWGENGQVNGNGQVIPLADTYENPVGSTFAKPTIWSISGEFDHHFSPQFTGSVEAAYGHVSWSGTNFSSVVSDSHSWIAGVVAHWDPVASLDFEFELLYQDSWTAQPNGFDAATSTGPWQPRADGFAARFEVTRSW
jgi:hypothetical protein